MRYPFLSFAIGVGCMILIGCRAVAQQPAAGPPASALSLDSEASGAITGKVVETMNSGGYTYVRVDDGSRKLWAATLQFTVTVGDTVVVPGGMPMRDFYSKTLQRTFDLVYFVPAIEVRGKRSASVRDQLSAAHSVSGGADHGGTAVHGGAGHSAGGVTAQVPALDLSNICKAEGGYTVAELFDKKAFLAGKEVTIRGRVAKFIPQVMGKNWLHVRDGTGDTGSNDVTVATTANATVGNLVLVHGKLVADKDLGFGYRYDIIIEDATVEME